MCNLYKPNIGRDTKKKAYRRAADAIRGYSPLISMKFKCALLFPSLDCNDLHEFREFFNEDTKFIVVENFSRLDGQVSRKEFQENFRRNLDEEGLGQADVFYHFGDFAELQLVPVLERLGVRKVDFMFPDCCDSLLHENICNFFWMNKDYIATNVENGFILMTKAIQPRNQMYDNADEAIKRLKNSREYRNHTGIDIVSGRKCNNPSRRLVDLVALRSFQISHMLNCHAIPAANQFKTIVYNGGGTESTKMGLFITQNISEQKDETRHEYYADLIILDNQKERGEAVVTSAIRSGCHHFMEGDMALANGVDFDPERADLTELFDYLFQKKTAGSRKDTNDRRFKTDRILVKIKSIFSGQMPPEFYDRSHKSSQIEYDLTSGLFEKFYLDRIFEYHGMRLVCKYGEKQRKRRAINVYCLDDDGRQTLVTPDNAAWLCPRNEEYLF